MNWFINVEDGFDWREIDGDLEEALKGYADAGFYKILVKIKDLTIMVTYRGKPLDLEGYWITCAPMRCEYPIGFGKLEDNLRKLYEDYEEMIEAC